MKRTLLLIPLIGLIGLVCVANLRAATLYDDFSTGYIKKTLWRDHPAEGRYLHEFVRGIDPEKGVLVLKLGTNERRTPMRNPVGFRNSRLVNRIRSEVKVMAVNIDTSGQADTATVFARIAGYFYNAVNSEPTDDIGDRGNGLEAWYRIEEVAGHEWGQVHDRGHGTLALNLKTETTYTMDLEHNGAGLFTFSIYEGVSRIGYARVQGPTNAGPLSNQKKAWVFVHWTGDVADDSAEATTIIMAEDEVVTAVFVDAAQDGDSDAVPDHLEYGPGGNDPSCDGNGDNQADSTQGNVSSCPSFDGSDYVTLAVADPLSLADVVMTGNPSPADAPAGLTFDWGFIQLTITGVAAGASADIQIHLPAGSTPETYHKYGPTAADASAHWYGFEYSAGTGLGAEYNANVITLHLLDGADGDDDLAANGQIADVGAPASGMATPAVNPPATNTGGGGGGGCFMQEVLP